MIYSSWGGSTLTIPHCVLSQSGLRKHLEYLRTLERFIDFRKSFDHLHHTRLIDKLSYYVVRGRSLEIINLYLQQRKKCLLINGYVSSLQLLKSGVPEDNTLGPILLNVYENDIFNICQHLRL